MDKAFSFADSFADMAHLNHISYTIHQRRFLLPMSGAELMSYDFEASYDKI